MENDYVFPKTQKLQSLYLKYYFKDMTRLFRLYNIYIYIYIYIYICVCVCVCYVKASGRPSMGRLFKRDGNINITFEEYCLSFSRFLWRGETLKNLYRLERNTFYMYKDYFN